MKALSRLLAIQSPLEHPPFPLQHAHLSRAPRLSASVCEPTDFTIGGTNDFSPSQSPSPIECLLNGTHAACGPIPGSRHLQPPCTPATIRD
jgi:hypothetical protein